MNRLLNYHSPIKVFKEKKSNFFIAIELEDLFKAYKYKWLTFL